MIFLALLVTDVQSVITSLESCPFSSTDGTCSGTAQPCLEKCLFEFNWCDWVTCDRYMMMFWEKDMSSFGECYSEEGMFDEIIRCVDNGIEPCDGADVCISQCFSKNGQCEEPCFQIGENVNISLYKNCDGYLENANIDHLGFQAWEECSNKTGEDVIATCNISGSSTDSNNTNMIVGIVIGAVLMVGAIVVVLIYKKSKTEL